MATDQPAPAFPVVVRPATPGERPLVEALARFYVYDFSEMEPLGSPNLDLDRTGEFGPLPEMDEYWAGEGAHALLIEVGGAPAGFVLLNTRSHRDGGHVAHNMGEFFVMRKYRRRGVAAHALRQVLAQHPGHWEIAVVERNTAALAFWPRAIASAPNITHLTHHDGDGNPWRGPIWSFHAVG